MIFDLHNDYLTSKQPDSMMIDCLDASIPNRQNSCPASIFNQIDSQQFCDMVTYAVWTTQLKNPVGFIKKVAKLGLKNTAIEDLHFINPKNLHILNTLNPRYASLTWNGENALAGGAHTDGGLTDWGKQVIKYLNQSGIFVDVAHLSRTAFYQAIDASCAPVICSHTCFSRLFDHRRNLTDAQLNTLIAKDGIIGLCLVSEFMGKSNATADDVVRQIDHFTQQYGINNLCIGSDFYGTASPAIKNYLEFNQLADRLKSLGYKQSDIDKIFYKNALNFFKIDYPY